MVQEVPGRQPLAPLDTRLPLVDQVTARVLSYIRTNQLGPGTRLPTTAEMAKSFGVAPTTLREALRRLETTGVLAVRHGVGIFVKSDASRLVLLNPDRLEPDRLRLASLVDARQLIEPTLAERAAIRRQPSEVAEMGRLLEASADLRADRAQAGQHNMQFHAQIAQAAGNRVLSDMLSAILELHTEDQLIIDRLFGDPERDHAEHLGIFDAIAAQQARRARDLMRDHLAEVLSSVESDTAARSRRDAVTDPGTVL